MAAPFNQNVELVGPYQSCAAGATGASIYTVSIPNAGILSIQWKADIPTVTNGGGASGLVVQIKNTTASSTLFTGTAGACSGGELRTLVAANDVITFGLSSTTAGDIATLNSVKCQIAFAQGI